MTKNLFKLVQCVTLILLTCVLFNCSESNEPQIEPEPEPEPELPNKALAGVWTIKAAPGTWLVNSDGEAKDVMIHHVFTNSSLDINRDSIIVTERSQFKLDYKPEEKLLTMVKDDVQTHYNVLSMEPTKIELEDKETTKTKTLKRISDYIVEAPESVEGFLLCANRFKVHGIVFSPNETLKQYFYYDAVIDYPVASYKYTKGGGNKAKIVYDLTYRINPDKVKIFTGRFDVYLDITFEYHGELDLEFYAHAYADKPNQEYYLGEFEGKVHSKVTNNRTGAVTESDITGRKYFALQTPDY